MAPSDAKPPARRCRTARAALLAPLLVLASPSPADDELVELFGELREEAPAASSSSAPIVTPADRYREIAGMPVTLRVEGVRNARGLVHVLLYDDAVAYRNGDVDRAVGYAVASALKGEVEMQLHAAGSGPYAAFAYHDEDGDESFGQLRGRPTEGFGFSGGVDYFQPTFERAATVTGAGRVRLLYLDPSPRR